MIGSASILAAALALNAQGNASEFNRMVEACSMLENDFRVDSRTDLIRLASRLQSAGWEVIGDETGEALAKYVSGEGQAIVHLTLDAGEYEYNGSRHYYENPDCQFSVSIQSESDATDMIHGAEAFLEARSGYEIGFEERLPNGRFGLNTPDKLIVFTVESEGAGTTLSGDVVFKPVLALAAPIGDQN